MARPFALPEPAPLSEQRGETYPALVAIMQRLLAPDGCPWDREQSMATLRKYVLEEACEVVDAIDAGDRDALRDELGDLALQVVFLGELARRELAFGPDDVIRAIVEKLVRRHPHVFAETSVSSSEEVMQNWERIKAQEKRDRFLLEGLPRSLPALYRAQRMGEKAAAVGFDWPEIAGSRAKVSEEIAELDAAIAEGGAERVEAELGDLLFALVNLARHLKLDAEAALRGAGDRFTRRFTHVERRVRERHGGFGAPGDSSDRVGLETLDGYWNEAKEQGL